MGQSRKIPRRARNLRGSGNVSVTHDLTQNDGLTSMTIILQRPGRDQNVSILTIATRIRVGTPCKSPFVWFKCDF